MGRLQAEEMVAQLSRRQGLKWHLQHNHFPPVPLEMVEVCEEAIDRAEDGEWTEPVTLPDGVTYRGRSIAAAHVVVERFHLEPWIHGDWSE